MKTKMKLLASSALLVASFGISDQSWGADNKSECEPSPSISRSRSSSIDLLRSTLYHQKHLGEYRNTVKKVRQNALELLDRVNVFNNNSELCDITNEIKAVQQTISLQQEALEKYGTEREVAQQKISKEIVELKKNKEKIQQDIEQKPSLEAVYKEQIRKTDIKLAKCQEYLASLERSENDLQSSLEAFQEYLQKLNQQVNRDESLEEKINAHEESLNNLYEGHVKGISDKKIFIHELPKTVLKDLGVSQAQLDNIDTDFLFNLFARTLELPYVSVVTGEDKEQAYEDQLKTIKNDLNARLSEDAATLALSARIMRVESLQSINMNEKEIEELLIDNPSDAIRTFDKKEELKTFRDILLSYKYKEENPPKFLETILNKSSYGLLGWYIASLEFAPVTSWNNKHEKMPFAEIALEDLSTGNIPALISKSVCTFLGRHINKKIIEQIESVRKDNDNNNIIPDIIIRKRRF